MKSSQYADSQIRAAQGVMLIPELCREHRMSRETFINGAPSMAAWMCRWMQRVKELEAENKRYTEELFKADILQDPYQKSGKAISKARDVSTHCKS
tara:strand:+ start:457 stop:744 length:288 start_codon:yes stop_codon:yes gene_type:complete